MSNKIKNYIMYEKDIDLKHQLLDEWIRYELVIAELKAHSKKLGEIIKEEQENEKLSQKPSEKAIVFGFCKEIIDKILQKGGI